MVSEVDDIRKTEMTTTEPCDDKISHWTFGHIELKKKERIRNNANDVQSSMSLCLN